MSHIIDEPAPLGIREMNSSTLEVVALLIMAVLVPDPVSAQETLPVHNCTWCHGSSAQGLSIAPRLAGQTYQYLENSLSGFKDHVRDNPHSKQYMWNATANLDKIIIHEFALYFSTLTPEPANDGDPASTDEGRKIYLEGRPKSNVVSCMVCHGPQAEGHENIPRLGGMSYAYLKQRLEEWKEGYDSAATPMPQIAKSLSASEIEALASYLSFGK